MTNKYENVDLKNRLHNGSNQNYDGAAIDLREYPESLNSNEVKSNKNNNVYPNLSGEIAPNSARPENGRKTISVNIEFKGAGKDIPGINETIEIPTEQQQPTSVMHLENYNDIHNREDEHGADEKIIVNDMSDEETIKETKK